MVLFVHCLGVRNLPLFMNENEKEQVSWQGTCQRAWKMGVGGGRGSLEFDHRRRCLKSSDFASNEELHSDRRIEDSASVSKS